MTKHHIAHLRKEYSSQTLDLSDVLADPFSQFARWFDEAIQSEITEPNAMTLATASANGMPSARVVLLKGVDDNGFVFYTNYQSHKAKEMEENPRAALLFCWLELERQLRIEGTVERVSAAESTEYFQSRPKGSQIGAWASPQSQVIPNREYLETKLAELSHQYAESDVLPRPEHWGGYRVRPLVIEFWQGRESRLHDRIRYRKEGNFWAIERLAP